MKHSRASAGGVPSRSVFPDLMPAGSKQPEVAGPRLRDLLPDLPAVKPKIPDAVSAVMGHVKTTTLSFSNMHLFGDLFVSLLKARKKTFIDQLRWSLPEAEGMEFDQYDTPLSRWIVVHEFGEILAVLFFEAPVNPQIWEASRLFVSNDVPAHRRLAVQAALMGQLSQSARSYGATHVIGIVPAVWSRWLRRLELSAVPVGPKFSIDETVSQAALFTVAKYAN